MRQLAVLVLGAALTACASSHTATPNLRQQCEDRFDRIWIASQSALVQLGARVVSSNQAAGALLARIEADAYGAPIEISVYIRRSPDQQPATIEPLWLEVRTWDPSTNDPDPERLEDMQLVARQFLALVRERAACGGPM